MAFAWFLSSGFLQLILRQIGPTERITQVEFPEKFSIFPQ